MAINFTITFGNQSGPFTLREAKSVDYIKSKLSGVWGVDLSDTQARTMDGQSLDGADLVADGMAIEFVRQAGKNG